MLSVEERSAVVPAADIGFLSGGVVPIVTTAMTPSSLRTVEQGYLGVSDFAGGF